MSGIEILKELDKSVHHEYSNFENSVSYFREMEYSIWKHLCQSEKIEQTDKNGIIDILEDMKENIPPEFERFDKYKLLMTIKNFQIMILQLN